MIFSKPAINHKIKRHRRINLAPEIIAQFIGLQFSRFQIRLYLAENRQQRTIKHFTNYSTIYLGQEANGTNIVISFLFITPKKNPLNRAKLCSRQRLKTRVQVSSTNIVRHKIENEEEVVSSWGGPTTFKKVILRKKIIGFEIRVFEFADVLLGDQFRKRVFFGEIEDFEASDRGVLHGEGRRGRSSSWSESKELSELTFVNQRARSDADGRANFY